MEIRKAFFTGNKVDKGYLFLFNSCRYKLLNAEINAASCCEHGIKYKHALLRADILWQLIIDEYRMLIFALLISLNQHLAYGDPWEEIRDLLNHRISRTNDSNCAIVLLFVL